MADYTKHSTERLNYSIDWSSETTDKGDTISTSSWSVPTGITLYSDNNDDDTATAYISGGRHGVTYTLSNTVTTTTSQLILEKLITVEVNDYV